MVFGLDAILPMEFLIPTLRVAKELEWTGHELSERIDELEKLDETRLRAVTGMYALKRRQKQFHDDHIITKQFRLGDLVLVYTLKEFAAKFTKRGRGPYVITRLSSSGAVRISTLDGEEMPNWFSGCRIKKYHLQPTQEQNARLHQAKWRQEKKKLIAEMAREEARQRAQKRKYGLAVPMAEGITKRYKIDFVDDMDDNDTPLPFIEVRVGEEKLSSHAFIDTGADGNTISHELYSCLKDVSITHTQAHFKDYSGHVTPAFGLSKLKLIVKELICGDEFFVTQPKVQDVPLILGRTWQKRYNCYFNWVDRTIHCQVGAVRIWVDLVQPSQDYGIKVEPLTLGSQASTSRQSRQPQIIHTTAKATNQETKECPTKKATAQEKGKQKLPEYDMQEVLPKASMQTNQQDNKVQRNKNQQTWRWVRKDELHGSQQNGKRWVRKESVKATTQQAPHTKSKAQQKTRQTMKWVRKSPPMSATNRLDDKRKELKKHQTSVKRWVRKDLLEAQKGQEFKWIPKVPKPQQQPQPNRHKSQEKSKRNKQQTDDHIEHQWIRQIWLPKNQVHRFGEGMAWIPKQTQNLQKESRPSTQRIPMNHRAEKTTIRKQWLPKGRSLQVQRMSPSTQPKERVEIKMCFKALNLQKQLFGMTSLLLPTNDWVEYVRKQQGYVPIKPQPWKEQIRMKQGYARLPAYSYSIPRSIQVS